MPRRYLSVKPNESLKMFVAHLWAIAVSYGKHLVITLNRGGEQAVVSSQGLLSLQTFK